MRRRTAGENRVPRKQPERWYEGRDRSGRALFRCDDLLDALGNMRSLSSPGVYRLYRHDGELLATRINARQRPRPAEFQFRQWETAAATP